MSIEETFGFLKSSWLSNWLLISRKILDYQRSPPIILKILDYRRSFQLLKHTLIAELALDY